MPVVASAALSIGVILILFSFFHVAWWISFPLGTVPFGATITYVLLFKQGKPPGYFIATFSNSAWATLPVVNQEATAGMCDVIRFVQ